MICLLKRQFKFGNLNLAVRWRSLQNKIKDAVLVLKNIDFSIDIGQSVSCNRFIKNSIPIGLSQNESRSKLDVK